MTAPAAGLATPGERWVAFLRSYGPISKADGMFAETVSRQAGKLGLTPLTFTHPETAALDAALDPNQVRLTNVILTGTAGDGKTTLCNELWLRLTDVNTTDLRHAECDKEGRLLVLLDESQAQSLSQVEAIDAASLLSVGQLDLWRGYSGAASELAEDGQLQWHAAIRALVELDRVSMRQFADYLVAVAQQLQAGSTLTAALGHALRPRWRAG